MPILETLIGGGLVQSVSDLAKGIIERIWPKPMTESEAAQNELLKSQAQAELEKILIARDQQTINLAKEVIVAEMAQGDNYTKRARPTIIYAGLAFILLSHILLPMLIWIAALFAKSLPQVPELDLPSDFWYVWGGVCSVWIVGRSAERRGFSNTVTKAITGKK